MAQWQAMEFYRSRQMFLREQVENRARLDPGEQGIVPKEAQSSEGALAR